MYIADRKDRAVEILFLPFVCKIFLQRLTYIIEGGHQVAEPSRPLFRAVVIVPGCDIPVTGINNHNVTVRNNDDSFAV